MRERWQTFAAWLAAIVGTLIVIASVIALVVEPDTFKDRKDQFESAVTNTLLPLFAAVAAAIVGQALASALRRHSA